MLNTGGLIISWLEALKNLGAETIQEKEIDTDAPLLLYFQNP